MNRQLTALFITMMVAVVVLAGCGSAKVVTTTEAAQAVAATTVVAATVTTAQPATTETVSTTSTTVKPVTTTVRSLTPTPAMVGKTTATTLSLVNMFVVPKHWKIEFQYATVEGDYKVNFIKDSSYRDEPDFAFAHVTLGNRPEVWIFQIGTVPADEGITPIAWEGDVLNEIIARHSEADFQAMVARITGDHLLVTPKS